MNNKKKYNNLKQDWGEPKTEDFDFDLIEKYFSKKDNSAYFQLISEKTINDINFHELFIFLDRTNSRIGQQYFYNKLRIIDSHYDFTHQEKLIRYFSTMKPEE